MKSFAFTFALALALGQWFLILPGAAADGIFADGDSLRGYLDGLGVERLWIAGAHVNWRTGKPDGEPETSPGVHSHCSAFAASACERLGIYLLRPPEHSQIDLANAQYDWLREKGAAFGWREAPDSAEAQQRANRGELVVAVFKAPEGKHGHIAIVRPGVKTAEAFELEGPEEIQAGIENYRSTNLKNGFRHHPGAWADHRIKFFSHEVKAEDLARVVVDRRAKTSP